MVTARSFGECLRRFFRRLAQRAANNNSAVESEPPETASRSTGTSSRPLNNALASSSRTAWSAMPTLLFSLHGLLYARRSARIFTQHFAKRGASRLLLAQCRQRLTEPQQRFGRSRGRIILGGNCQECFGCVAILLLLEQAFAEPVLRFGRQPVAGILPHERAEAIGRKAVILVQNIAISEVVSVARRIRRRQRRLHGAGRAWIGWRGRRQCGGRGDAGRRQIERRTDLTRGGRLGDRRRRLGGGRAAAKRPRRTRRVRIGCRIEGIAAPAACRFSHGRSRYRRHG